MVFPQVYGPWFADNGGFAGVFAICVFTVNPVGAVGFLKAIENGRKLLCVGHKNVSKSGDTEVPPVRFFRTVRFRPLLRRADA